MHLAVVDQRLIKMRANSLAERLTGSDKHGMKRRKCLITCFCKFLIVSALTDPYVENTAVA